jgi:hypothetical protein
MDIFRFRKYTVNNAVLSGKNAMPMKDSTSDGTADFALSRANYTNAFVAPTVSETLQKKWIGGNRDASQIVANRHAQTVGTSINLSGRTVSFVGNSNRSTVDQALTRVRGGGAVVPPKVAASPHIHPTPSFAPVALKRMYGVKQPHLYH